MDVAEAVSQMKAAYALTETLGGAAAQQQALFSQDTAQAQAELVQQLDPNAGGRYSGAVNGQQGVKAKSGTRELDPGQPVEKFASSLVLLDSPANINWATPASTVIYGGQCLHWTTSSDLHHAAAYTMSSVSGTATSLFTHSGGIQVIAANGPVSLHAHTDQMELLSDAEVTVISVNDSIEINAKEKIVLQAAQCSVTLDGGNITFACPGSFAAKAGQHVFDKGGKRQAELPHLPDTTSKIGNFIALHYRDADGEAMAGVPYKIKFEGGVVIKGKLDGSGSARHENVPDKPICAEYEERDPLPDKPWDPLAEMLAKAHAMFGKQA
jgi:type VI secretion system secreted protein VgrG